MKRCRNNTAARVFLALCVAIAATAPDAVAGVGACTFCQGCPDGMTVCFPGGTPTSACTDLGCASGEDTSTECGSIPFCPSSEEGQCDDGVNNDAWQNDETDYDDPACILPTGACCELKKGCFITSADDCDGRFSTYFGDDTICGATTCDGITGACCFHDAPCLTVSLETAFAECEKTGGFFLGTNTVCEPDTCESASIGACCFNNGFCLFALGEECTDEGGSYQGDGTVCEENLCPLVFGACCLPWDRCVETFYWRCGPGSVFPDGVYQGDNTTCLPYACPLPTGACCVSGNACVEKTRSDCYEDEGWYAGDFTNCTGDDDLDGAANECDLCPGIDDNGPDHDQDGVPNQCDTCPGDRDDDRDGVCNSADQCLGDDASGDTDGDGFCDDADPDCEGCPHVAVLGADELRYRRPVVGHLSRSGKFASVTNIDATTVVPTVAELNAFDAVIVWSNWNYADHVTLGNHLAAYHDAGGGVVTGIFENHASLQVRNLAGRWEVDVYNVLVGSSTTFNTTNFLGDVLLPGHPTMAGVANFGGGHVSWRPSSTAVTPGGEIISKWDDGKLLVVTNECFNGHPRVDLGFFPPDTGGGAWDPAVDGGRLLANAVAYAAAFADADGDRVADGCDVCPDTALGAAVDFLGCPAGDCNGDGAIDASDHGDFASCLAGPGSPLLPGCECFDFDFEGDVDLRDFAGFSVSFGSP